jgi:ATP-dependent Lon protease
MSKKEDLLSAFETEEKTLLNIPKKLSVLPLRDVVIFPYMIFPVLIGRNSSLKAVAEAMERDKYMFVTSQVFPDVEEPQFTDLYDYSTIVRILQVLRLPNNLLKVLVEGIQQGKIKRRYNKKEFLEAEIERISFQENDTDNEFEALSKKAGLLFTEYVKREPGIPQDMIIAYDSIVDNVQKLYFGAANVRSKIENKQRILNKFSLKEQYFEFITILSTEIELQRLEEEISGKVNEAIQKSQRKYFIQEQIRALQHEMGDDEDALPELALIREMIQKANLPDAAKAKAEEEFERLRKTPTLSPEFSVNRNYIEWLTQLPWTNSTEDIFDIKHVKEILDEDHFDLEKPKERILEFIAVLNIAGKLKRQILCFVGPPGVGKTSLGKSIARAMGRKFIRFSLGGVRDEAEIRGHRRTYIGALPGKIIQSMKKAGTINPVILLDEIDKMSMDFRGDPSSALLEVLDPEQNFAFNDHYLEVDYDLSNVLFITTANVRYEIPLPLLDRMEIIELNSYIDPEKLQIAKKHIIPKLKAEYGLNNLQIDFTDEAILKLIREYTRESGVRNLEREIASIFRKLSKEIVEDYFTKLSEKNIDLKKLESKNKEVDIIEEKTEDKFKIQLLCNSPEFNKQMVMRVFKIDEERIEHYLKSPRFKDKKELLEDKVGVVTGLAWTSVGGDTLPIEVTIMPGTEKLTLTGKLGDVMKESAMAAFSFLRSNFEYLKLKENFAKNKEIHIHVPEGAIQKDGPSAGITMGIALLSAASGKAVRGDVAMTGEITLRGNILPIGGLKEKLLTAKRYGIKTVIIPEENTRDLVDIGEDVKSGLEIKPVKHFFEALPIVFNDFETVMPVMKSKKG